MGYRRRALLPNYEGLCVNKEKLFLLDRDEGLAVRKRRGREQATGTQVPMLLPDAPNQRWALDFVADMWRRGRRIRMLCIVDDYRLDAPALVVAVSMGGDRLARDLD